MSVNYKDEILKRVAKIIDRQTAKGVAKYGHTLEDCPVDEYDWQKMLIEELIDALQYQQKEIDRLSSLLSKLNKEFEILIKERGRS